MMNKTSKSNFFDELETADTGAALKEQSKTTPASTKPKHLNAMPAGFFDAHKNGKKNGVTSLDFSQYIYEATREKLQKDGLI